MARKPIGYHRELTTRLIFWLLASATALLMLAPIRAGDLAGYDDAVYAHIARAIVESGDWIDIQSNGYPALEHPPGFVWMQAALFSLFGLSDFLAKLPSAVCGVGTVLLVYWLARRLLQDELAALLAMFVMAATPYFIKYTSHGMMDVPFTFLFAAAICAWILARRSPAWYFGVWAFTAYALLLRGIGGLMVPAVLAAHLLVYKRPYRWKYAAPALALAFLPLGAWYAHLYSLYGDFFWQVQSSFLAAKLGGDGLAAWRRYTGVFEYAWMLAQSYWPWLPFTVGGLVIAIRHPARGARPEKRTTERGPRSATKAGPAMSAGAARGPARFRLLLLWSGVVYAACSVAGSRVLRYLLPAYPAFAIFAVIGLQRWIPERHLRRGLQWLAPAALVAAAVIAVVPPVNLHAAEIKPIAAAAAANAAPKERIAFYDDAQPRFDETGQIQWYGGRILWILTEPSALTHALAEPIAKVWIVDEKTYRREFPLRPHTVLARSGHLWCLRLEPAPASPTP
jgi:4-amino-4-deoxy-L-arabinose transferase-like glycosyltransferase